MARALQPVVYRIVYMHVWSVLLCYQWLADTVNMQAGTRLHLLCSWYVNILCIGLQLCTILHSTDMERSALVLEASGN